MTDIKSVKKVVLAYSGGLDTSVIIPWLKENYGCEVIACTVNLGQPEDFDAIHKKALASGAEYAETLDVRKEFIEEYAYKVLQADGRYEGKYLLGTSFARPLIGKCLVDMAKKYGADAICHGATGKGNDQVRFELTIKALAPHMKIIAPWRIWDMKSREDEMAYAEAHGVPIDKYDEKQTDEEKAAQKYPYSMDWNMWHLSHEGDDLENPANAPHKDMYLVTCDPEEAPDKPEIVTIDFEKGIPTAVNGKKMDGVELVNTLNAIGARNGIGIDDLVENRLVGMKTHAAPSFSTLTPNWNASALIARPSISKKSLLSNTRNSYMMACGSHRCAKHCRPSLTRPLKPSPAKSPFASTRATSCPMAQKARTPCTMKNSSPSAKMMYTTRQMQKASSTSSACRSPSALS